MVGLDRRVLGLQHLAAHAPSIWPQTWGCFFMICAPFHHFHTGARAPLCEKYWPELVECWDSCGKAYHPIALDIRTEDGHPRPENPDDVKQVETRFPGNCSKGELTIVGQEQALKFGRWLRTRYVDTLAYLPPERTTDSVLSRTTNYSRTRATLAGVLTGLYPGDPGPVPAITTPYMDELLYANVHSCSRLKQLVKELHSQSKGTVQGVNVRLLGCYHFVRV